MIDTFSKQATDMLAAASQLEVPTEVRKAALEGVELAREAISKWQSTATNYANAIEETVTITRSSAKTISAKMMANAAANIEAALDAAQKLASAKSIAEVAQIQTKFVQDQLAIAGEQSKAIFELSTKIAMETTESLRSVATKAAQNIK